MFEWHKMKQTTVNYLPFSTPLVFLRWLSFCLCVCVWLVCDTCTFINHIIISKSRKWFSHVSMALFVITIDSNKMSWILNWDSYFRNGFKTNVIQFQHWERYSMSFSDHTWTLKQNKKPVNKIVLCGEQSHGNILLLVSNCIWTLIRPISYQFFLLLSLRIFAMAF